MRCALFSCSASRLEGARPAMAVQDPASFLGQDDSMSFVGQATESVSFGEQSSALCSGHTAVAVRVLCQWQCAAILSCDFAASILACARTGVMARA